jgi:hypothetical protein
MLVGGFVLLIVVSLILAVLAQINWQALIDPFVRLALMLALLYWATTLLPGPIKKVGRTAGRQVMKTMTRRRNRD